MPRQVPESLFSRADALEAGWSDAALHRAVRSGRLHRVRRGYYALPNAAADPVLAALAAARSCAGSVVSHRSAALAHGLPLLATPSRPEITVSPTGTGDVARALLHRATLGWRDVTAIRGMPVTNPARTLIDIARSSTLAAALVPLDAALHSGLVSPGELAEVALACWNWPGIRRAHRALDHADARSESPLETVSRLVLRWLRLPDPDLQRVIVGDHGGPVARADFYWEESGVIGEADGHAKYDSRDVLVAEKYRQEALEQLGLVVVRWGWTDVTQRPQLLRERIRSAFERGDRRDRSGLPRLWSVAAA